MGHTLFTGVTESGKTTLARYVSRLLLSKKQNVMVYDPVQTETRGGGWGEKAIIFNDFDQMIDFIEEKNITHHHLFIDEAMEHFGVGDKHNHWLATRGRHKHLYCNFLAQRPKMIAPNVRTQCRTCYMFRLSPDDMDSIGEDFGHGNLSRFNLEQGEFLKLTSAQSQIGRSSLDKVFQNVYKGVSADI